MKRFITLTIILILLVSCNREEGLENIKSHSLISFDQFEKIELFNTDGIRLYINNNYIYVSSSQDGMVARFNANGKPDRKYANIGQGPGEFQLPDSIFPESSETLCVFDRGKTSVIIFDRDLNLIKEMLLDSRTRKITKYADTIYSFGDYNNHSIAIVDNEYNLMETFNDVPTEVPFSSVNPFTMYMCYIFPGYIASTSWGYYSPECNVDIINPKTKEIETSLTWKNPYPQTEHSIKSRKNSYSCYHVSKYGNYFVVQTLFAKEPNGVTLKKLLIFNMKGKIVKEFTVPFLLLQSYEENGTRLYFFDKEDNLSYCEINDIVG